MTTAAPKLCPTSTSSEAPIPLRNEQPASTSSTHSSKLLGVLYSSRSTLTRASPSKGVLIADFQPSQLAVQYAEGGAAALSVLTDRDFF
ncbi:hypothetical protein EDM76_04015, partial [bacterium]